MPLKVEEYVMKGNEFIGLVARHLPDPDNFEYASCVTTSVLHTLRDILTPEQSIHLIAQLPLYIKAAYVDGWVAPSTPFVKSDGADLLERLRAQNNRCGEQYFANMEEGRQNVGAVLEVLKKYVGPLPLVLFDGVATPDTVHTSFSTSE